MTPKRRRDVERAEKRHGVRKDLSRRAVGRDPRPGSVPSLHEPEVCCSRPTRRRATPQPPGEPSAADGWSMGRRTASWCGATWNPLFAINHEEAVMRDLMGRLRRESWLVSKKRRYLDLALHLHMALPQPGEEALQLRPGVTRAAAGIRTQEAESARVAVVEARKGPGQCPSPVATWGVSRLLVSAPTAGGVIRGPLNRQPSQFRSRQLRGRDRPDPDGRAGRAPRGRRRGPGGASGLSVVPSREKGVLVVPDQLSAARHLEQPARSPRADQDVFRSTGAVRLEMKDEVQSSGRR